MVHSCIAYDRTEVGWRLGRVYKSKVSRVLRCNAPRILNGVIVIHGGKLVMRLATKEEPQLTEKDKFRIQSTIIPPVKETLSLTEIVSPDSPPSLVIHHYLTIIWVSLHFSHDVFVYVMTTQWNTNDGEIHSKKIRVAFLPPEGGNIRGGEESALVPPVQPSAFNPLEVSMRTPSETYLPV